MSFIKDPLKLVTFKVTNLDDVWEEIKDDLVKEKGLTQAGIDLPKKTLSYAYHPDFWTVEKLTEKIKALGGKITKTEEK